MKSLYYTLGAVMLVLLVIAAALVNAPVRQAKNHRPPTVVYVDIDQLVGLHPGSKMLAEMRALTVASRGGAAAGGSASVPAMEAFSPDCFVQRPEISRPEIEAEVAQSAVSALSRLETDQRRALQARTRATRATMMESAKSEIAAQVREIEKRAVFNEHNLTAQLGPMRLANEIKQGALKQGLDIMNKAFATGKESKPEAPEAALKVSSQEKNELTDLSDRLQLANIELGRINDTLTVESAAIKAEAQQKINELRAASKAGIDTKLTSTESAERTKIETGIATARNEVLFGLSSSDVEPELCEFTAEGPAARPAGLASVNKTAQSPAGVLGPTASTVRASVPAVAARIRLDVSRVVSMLAANEGLRVTFVKSSKAAPDATARFAGLLRERGAELWGPVLTAGSARLLPSGSAGASPSPGRG